MLKGDSVIAYIVEDILYLIYKDRVIQNSLKDVIYQGFIIDKEKFMDSFLKIIKKEKIKNKLFGDTITILKNAFYSSSDIFFLDSIFNELGFIKVNYWDIHPFLSDDHATYIEINESYMIVYLDKDIYLDLKYFKDIPTILGCLKYYFKDYIILFGMNKNIPNIKLKNFDIYYLEEPKNYILKSLLKVKKYDA